MGCLLSKSNKTDQDRKMEREKNRRAKKVLVTGYGPFRDILVNPSWQAVKALPHTLQGFKIITRECPVSYSFVTSTVPSLIDLHKPKLVIHVGCGPKGGLKLETQAWNTGYMLLDVDGCLPSDAKCCPSVPHEPLTTLLPAQAIATKLSNKWEIKTSTDAGRYLCEFIFCTSMAHLHGKVVPCLFVHVPPVGHPYTQHELDRALEEVACACIAALPECTEKPEVKG
jgi:pyroglutamyl-peptidase